MKFTDFMLDKQQTSGETFYKRIPLVKYGDSSYHGL